MPFGIVVLVERLFLVGAGFEVGGWDVVAVGLGGGEGAHGLFLMRKNFWEENLERIRV